MIEWLAANAGISNGLMALFAAGCFLAVSFSSWALRTASSRLQQARAFYEWYLEDQAPHPNADEGERK